MNQMTVSDLQEECTRQGKVLRVERRPGAGTHAELRPRKRNKQTAEL